MFTRTIQLSKQLSKQLPKASLIAAVLSTIIAPLAHAQIAKCVDVDGSIVYSNTSCGNAVAIGIIDDKQSETPRPARVEVAPTASSDHGQLRETPWTHRTIPTAKKVLDKSTIRDAREALAASDRAMAFLRQQTLAANN